MNNVKEVFIKTTIASKGAMYDHINYNSDRVLHMCYNNHLQIEPQ